MKKLALLLLLSATTASAALVNGTTQPISSLRAAPANGWVAYKAIAREAVTVSCCDNWSNGWQNCKTCRLEHEGSLNINTHDKDDIGPVGEKEYLIFAKMTDGVAERIRIFSATCDLDAGGNTVSFVNSVSRADSLDFLRNAAERGDKKARNGALLALSLHEGATDTLIDLARRNDSKEVRGQALFWLSQAAGHKAAEALKDAVNNDPEESVRAKAVFGISQLPNDESIPLLIDLMKNNRSREVRKKAAFWLGQKNDPRALAAIEDILRN
jgi:HEAT repeat protein